MERLILQIGFGEYLAQLAGGIPMSQGEIARPADVGLGAGDGRGLPQRPGGRGADRRRQHRRRAGAPGRADAGSAGRRQLRRHRARRRLRDDPRPVPPLRRRAGRAARARLAPQGRADPDGDRRGDGRARGLRPDHPRGIRRRRACPKTAMCVVSEELSRGYIGVGSLGTRSEIAAELILGGGTEAQKAEWLPKIASAEILPTAVFTEPNTGSDLGALAHPRGARRRRLRGHRQQDLDHPCRPHRRDDDAGAHRPRHHRPYRPVDAARAEAARDRGRRLSGARA